MSGNEETMIMKNVTSSEINNNRTKNNYRFGRAIAVIIFWLGVVAAIVGLATILVFAFLMYIEPDTVRTNFGFVPNHARWAYVGGIITGASIAISGLLSALMGQLAVAIFDMSRKIQNL